MPIPGNILTTAMAVMPHIDVNRALKTALSLDIPFWPQLPNLTYYEDMYVQAAEHFPGILLDLNHRTLRFSTDKFAHEIEEVMSHFEEQEYFDISPTYSQVYHRFLEMDLSKVPAIRGQLEGPISFGFNIQDENDRPILFNDTVRQFMLEFMAQRINVQLKRLKKINPNAFMFVDEPGLQYIFNAMSGYNDMTAKNEMDIFFSLIDRPRGIHLCGNPDWSFLLNLDLDILSMDVFLNGEIIVSYHKEIKKFLDRGGVLVWGIVPTNFEPFYKEQLKSLEKRLIQLWDTLSKKGIDQKFLLSRSLISPATCCLVNPDGETTVEKAFLMVKELSLRMRDSYKIE
ncbi:MAG: hypothetical protein HQK79_20280 [Desulfobacterales bacterium]|nr:hypothetical protein [Desulfobacterales bacterium]